MVATSPAITIITIITINHNPGDLSTQTPLHRMVACTAPHAPLELLLLLLNRLEGKVACLAPQLDRGEAFPLLLAHALQHFKLDGEAVAVPAGDVARLAALVLTWWGSGAVR